jgi:hypothetical protein
MKKDNVVRYEINRLEHYDEPIRNNMFIVNQLFLDLLHRIDELISQII